MENLAVKVLYRGKIIIIGKGIRTQQSIVNHLQKRFNIPQDQIKLFSLQYEDDAKDLNEAYQKAFQKGKQSVRIKIQLVKPQEKLMQQTEPQSKKETVAMISQDNVEELKSKQIQKQQSQSHMKKDQKEEPHVVFEQPKYGAKPQIKKDNADQQIEIINQKGQKIEQSREDNTEQKVSEEKYYTFVSQLSEQKIRIPNVSQPLQAEHRRIQQIDENKDKKQQMELKYDLLISTKDQISPLLQNKSLNQRQDQEVDKDSQKSSSGLLQSQQPANKNQQNSQIKPLSQTEMIDKFPVEKIVEDQQKSQYNGSLKNEERKSRYIPKLQYQNEKQNPDYYFKSIVPPQASMLIIQTINNFKFQMRKQFDDKLNQMKSNYTILELKHSDLQSKYQDLLQKYQSLTFIVSKHMIKDEKQQKSFIKQQKMESKPQMQGYQKIPYFDPAEDQEQKISQPQVQIQNLETRTQIQVGQSIKPQFFLVNTGETKWPKNVVAISQNMQKIPIKSLQKNGEFILEMKDIQIKRAGQKISRKYKLGYYNKKGELKMFGRRFGIDVTGVVKQKLVEKENNQFVNYINNLMLSNGMMVENLQLVIENLREMSVNEDNYKQADRSTLIEILKSM